MVVKRILLIRTFGNVWRTVQRICILVLAISCISVNLYTLVPMFKIPQNLCHKLENNLTARVPTFEMLLPFKFIATEGFNSISSW